MSPRELRQTIIGIVLIIAAAAIFLAYAFMPVPVPSPVKLPPVVVQESSSPNLRNVSVKPGDLVTSPLTVTGEARTWYFEGSFPVKLLGGGGVVLAQVPAQALSDWMTTEFVPFKATLEFSALTTATGTLVLKNDNPSGLPEKDEWVRVPVRFIP